ncbi:sodium transporter HKT1-like [Tripterygium wilfordii]|uniref:sodium transporter HKT1-like n=1 Tax=Tripterygium wilfordii TaxID=458696 RepID=UPI0018F838BF|nr:sodium transporter HKT1-like [Tripterygium wilfordii]
MAYYFTSFSRKLNHLCILLSRKAFGLLKSLMGLVQTCFKPFWIQISYFIIVSVVGYLSLKLSSNPKSSNSITPKDFDLFFTSVSATTVSSMSTIEMEIFSNTQLIIITVLMFLGGEVFTSFLGLQFHRLKLPKRKSSNSVDQIEMGLVNSEKPSSNFDPQSLNNDVLIKYSALRCLGYAVLGYLLVVQIAGSCLVLLYVSVKDSARELLKNRGIHALTFSVFTVISTFSNCGFVPTNENMMVFNRNSGLLLLLIPQILLGNTLYPPFLRFLIWVLDKITKRTEYSYILKNTREMGYSHLFSTLHCSFLLVTAFGFVLVQFVVFCILEWQSESMGGLNGYQKFVAALFQVVNSRHAGESVVDLSSISPAILVLFVVMMYLPPYTLFLPTKRQADVKKSQRTSGFVENVLFSQLSYLVIFVILICITERDKMKNDPLNFNVLNITLEVISAYGNVGFSTCYSCKRQLKPEGTCKDAWYGFVGWWSYKGKLILICVMFFGRLKNFNINGGQAWVLM